MHKKQEVLGYIENKKTEEIDVIEKLENAINQENFNNINESEENKNIIKTLEEKLNYKYPFIVDTKIPTKTSVTALKKLAIKEENSTNNFMDLNKRESINTIEKDTEKTGFNNMNPIVEFPKPKFLNDSKEEKITSAKKGTLVHMCLQRLNEKENYDFNKIKQLIEKLQAKKIITEKEAQSININKVLAFTKSKIWTELKKAKEVYKEKTFYINIPAKDVYGEETEENILVQGIIDLYYIDKNGELKLVDYKTDYVQPGEENKLVEKYKKQLDLYAKALEKVYKKKVSEKYIYSVYLEKEIKIY